MTSIDSLVNLETYKKIFLERKAQEDSKKVLTGAIRLYSELPCHKNKSLGPCLLVLLSLFCFMAVTSRF